MRILIAEDDAVSRRVLQATLTKWGYEVQVATNGEQAWEVLQRTDCPRLAILDWMMPGVDGAELCRRIRSLPDGQYVYVILLTARADRDDAVKGLEAGADDYVTKPFDARELKVRIQAGRRIVELQEQLVATRENLRLQSMRDSFTQLWNRVAALDMLRNELDRGRRNGTAVSVLMCDVDGLKQVNDGFGHQAGDMVLLEVVKRLQESVRSYDVVGRYGGDEFLVVLPHCGGEDALGLGERLRASVSEQWIEFDGQKVKISLSVGIATACDVGSSGAEMIVRRADDALYRAKAQGKNCVVVDESRDCQGQG